MKPRRENTIFALITLIYYIHTRKRRATAAAAVLQWLSVRITSTASDRPYLRARLMWTYRQSLYTRIRAFAVALLAYRYVYIVIPCSTACCYHIINNLCMRLALGLIYKSEKISGNPLETHGTGSSESYMRSQCVHTKLGSNSLGICRINVLGTISVNLAVQNSIRRPCTRSRKGSSPRCLRQRRLGLAPVRYYLNHWIFV